MPLLKQRELIAIFDREEDAAAQARFAERSRI
jgi:hypothetical protein